MKWLLPLTCVLLGAAAAADPMRPLTPPPGAASSGALGSPRVAVPGLAAATATRTAPAAAAGTPLPPLQAIRTNGDGTRRALIGEDWHKSGARLGDARLLSIGESSIEVSRDGRRSIVHLLPPLQDSRPPNSGGARVADRDGAAPTARVTPQRPTRAPAPRQP